VRDRGTEGLVGKSRVQGVEVSGKSLRSVFSLITDFHAIFRDALNIASQIGKNFPDASDRSILGLIVHSPEIQVFVIGIGVKGNRLALGHAAGAENQNT